MCLVALIWWMLTPRNADSHYQEAAASWERRLWMHPYAWLPEATEEKMGLDTHGFLLILQGWSFCHAWQQSCFCARLQMCYDFSGVPRRFGSHQLSCEVNKTAHVRASAWCVCVCVIVFAQMRILLDMLLLLSSVLR